MNSRNPVLLFGSTLCFAISLVSLGGCEPRLNSFQETPTFQSDLLVSDLRGMKLDWPVDGDHLEVTKPPRLEFLNTLTGLQKTWRPVVTPDPSTPETLAPAPWSIPQDLLPEHEQEALLRALGEVKAEIRAITDVPCQISSDGRFYDISPDSNWLASAHAKLQIWDLRSSAPPIDGAIDPSAPITCLKFSADSKHLLVARGNKLAQVDVASGAMVKELDLPAEAQSISIGAHSEWLVVALKNDRVAAVKSDFSDWATLSEQIPSAYPAPALSPSGRTLAFWTDQGGAAITLTNGNITNRVELSFLEWSDAPENPVCLGTICDDSIAYWLTKDRGYSFRFADSVDIYRNFQWPLLAAAQGTQPGPWIVAAFSRPGGNNTLATPACIDMEINPNVFVSTPVDLPLSSVSSLRCDPTGTRIACQKDDRVYVYQRTKWVNRDTSVFAKLVRTWMQNGQCEWLEKVAPVLRAMPDMKLNRSGEQWHKLLVFAAARVRTHPEEFNLSADILKKQDEWFAADSTLARHVAAAIEIGIARKLYFGLLRGEGTQDQMDEVERLTRLAIQKANRLIAEPNPSLSAYSIKAEALLPSRTSVEAATPFIQEAVKRFPLDYSLHNSILSWLAPYSIGERGDMVAYAYALANAIGGDQGDRMYAELAVNIIFMAKGSPATANFRDDMLTRGILVGLKEDYWTIHEMVNLTRAQCEESMSSIHPTSRKLLDILMQRTPVAAGELRPNRPNELTPRT